MAEASASSHDVVHTPLSAPDRSRQGEDNTPTTPTPNVRFSRQPPTESDAPAGESAPETPTRHSFGGVRGQRALPDDPPSAHGPERAKREELSLKRGSSNRSVVSGCSDDVEMGEGDAEEGAEDDGSDNESVTSDSQRPSKKKKGQRFFCTEFPPCQLSFTRSEHLARHIRLVEMNMPSMDVRANSMTGNTPESDPFNVIAHADSLASTTSANMRRLCTSTRIFLVIRLRLRVQGFSVKSGPTGFVHQETVGHVRIP